MNRKLFFDYDELFGQFVEGVYGEGVLFCDDGSKSFDRVYIKLDNSILKFQASAETDEVNCDIVHNIDQKEFDNKYRIIDAYCGSQLGYIWSAVNWRGYSDMVIVSFNAAYPSIAIISIASMLKVFEIIDRGIVEKRISGTVTP